MEPVAVPLLSMLSKNYATPGPLRTLTVDHVMDTFLNAQIIPALGSALENIASRRYIPVELSCFPWTCGVAGRACRFLLRLPGNDRDAATPFEHCVLDLAQALEPVHFARRLADLVDANLNLRHTIVEYFPVFDQH